MDTKDLDLLERAFAAEIDAAAKAALAMARNAWIAGQAAERERCAVTWERLREAATPGEKIDDTLRRYADVIRGA